jgi:hypothetical protein
MSQKQRRTLQSYLARLTGFVVLGLSLGLPAAFAQPPAETPDPNELYFLDEITHGGTGCPQGSLSAVVSPDGDAVTVTFDEYVAEVGPDTPPIVRKFCNINLPLHIPFGWQYSVVELDYRGYLYLDHHVYARQESTYYFQGQQNGPTLSSNWYGPEARDFAFTDFVGLETHNWSWSPCDEQRHLTVKTSMVLNNRYNRHSFGYISTDSIDAEITHRYGLYWRRCGASPHSNDILNLDR